MAKRMAKTPKAFSTIAIAIAQAIIRQPSSPVYPIMHSFHLHNLRIDRGVCSHAKVTKS